MQSIDFDELPDASHTAARNCLDHPGIQLPLLHDISLLRVCAHDRLWLRCGRFGLRKGGLGFTLLAAEGLALKQSCITLTEPAARSDARLTAGAARSRCCLRMNLGDRRDQQ